MLKLKHLNSPQINVFTFTQFLKQTSSNCIVRSFAISKARQQYNKNVAQRDEFKNLRDVRTSSISAAATLA